MKSDKNAEKTYRRMMNTSMVFNTLKAVLIVHGISRFLNLYSNLLFKNTLAVGRTIGITYICILYILGSNVYTWRVYILIDTTLSLYLVLQHI